MTLIGHLIKLTIGFLAVYIVYQIFISNYKQTESRKKLPDNEFCSYYKEEQNRFIPARCLKYFNN